MNKETFQGRWEIIETELWDKEDLDITETAYIQFDGDSGQFHFLCVDGFMDIDYTGKKAEFSWQGNDEMDETSGRGWALIVGNEMHGKIYFHNSDASTFVAKQIEE
jgi:hypothetical protein